MRAAGLKTLHGKRSYGKGGGEEREGKEKGGREVEGMVGVQGKIT